MAKRKTVTKRKPVAKRKAVAKGKALANAGRKAVAKRKAVTKPKARQDREKRSAEDRIEELKRRANELSGGEMQVETLDDYPEETEEAFWKHVVDYEEAPWTTNFQQLENAGVSLPAPESLNDEELTAKLWEVIQKLALLHVYIEQTDHLSDRELYTHLWTDSLREETKAMALAAGGAWHIQILGGCSEEDNQLYLKYYADDDWRRQWHKDFPEDSIPTHEDPPYDRDRLLPKHDYDAPIGGEPN
ncbi:MAG TPA: hypothetical protein VFP59_14535 [Candidatus Angelobacter sp.]|nr:hypothetical protein [Candidatus Angelobacter sp.]